MRFQGAVIREQRVTFAIVIVKDSVINDRNQASQVASGFLSVFPGMPVVLMGQDMRGRARFFGRDDIVRFLANVPLSAIPWREYTI